MRACKYFDRWLGDNQLGDLARAAEEAGFDAIAETDHPFPDVGVTRLSIEMRGRSLQEVRQEAELFAEIVPTGGSRTA